MVRRISSARIYGSRLLGTIRQDSNLFCEYHKTRYIVIKVDKIVFDLYGLMMTTKIIVGCPGGSHM